jgi:hypothetical protein
MSSEAATLPAAPKGPKYTGVVYFHGMGDQRRYEEISRLIDALDRYARDPDKTGHIVKITPRVESPRVADIKKTVAYIATKRVGTGKAESHARFYEVYWAPFLAGGVPSIDVLRWLVRQIPNPIRTLSTPWRLRARLRRSSLLTLWLEQCEQKDCNYTENDVQCLLNWYDDFEGAPARRAFAEGNYRQFRQWIRGRPNGSDELKGRVIQLSDAWRRYVVIRELGHLMVLVTVALYLLLAAGALVASAALAVNLLVRLPPGVLAYIPLETGKAETLISIAIALAGIFGVQRFLSNYLGDVQAWTTYEEVDERHRKRHEVLEHGAAILDHVLADPLCERVVVVAHSLGTAVAQDVLLELGRRSRVHALDPADSMWKLDLFITMGSPVDKIHYFFESHRGRYHRYNRVVEELRGDLGTAPFAKNTQRHIHWINIWDKADVISGSLESPANRRRHAFRVDNVEIASFEFPAAGKSHSAYFDHRGAVEILFRAIYERAYSFKNAPRNEKNHPPDYASCMAGPGKGLKRTRILQALMLALPWLIAATAVTHALGALSLRDAFAWAGVLLFFALTVNYFAGRNKRLDPLPAGQVPAPEEAVRAAGA